MKIIKLAPRLLVVLAAGGALLGTAAPAHASHSTPDPVSDTVFNDKSIKVAHFAESSGQDGGRFDGSHFFGES